MAEEKTDDRADGEHQNHDKIARAAQVRTCGSSASSPPRCGARCRAKCHAMKMASTQADEPDHLAQKPAHEDPRPREKDDGDHPVVG